MLVYTLKILTKLVNFRRLKSAVGHEHVNKNEVYWNIINHQLIKIKFTFEDRLNGNKFVADKRVAVDGDNECVRETASNSIRARSGVPGLTDTIWLMVHKMT